MNVNRSTARTTTTTTSENTAIPRFKPLKYPLDPEVCQKAARYAVRVSEEMSKRSTLLKQEENPNDMSVAKFDREEILPYLGELLGKGGFNSVYELSRMPVGCKKTNDDNDDTENSNTSRKYAVKFLSDDAMYSPDEFCNGAADLLMEAKYLTALSATHPHPALIQLHGVCRTGAAGFNNPDRAGFFLVIDRLYDTLDRHIDVWRELERRKVASRAPARILQALFIQRLLVAQDIASALRHLHKLNIIFRDLKPDNVGFDFEGQVKLFDFGLAKELDPKQKNDDGMYLMSGGTGSRRFMAPEVALSEPYDLSADIYSFSILLWELLALGKAFGHISTEDHREKVVKRGERPTMDKRWSVGMQSVLESSWARNPYQRPKAKDLFFDDATRGETGLHGRVFDNGA